MWYLVALFCNFMPVFQAVFCAILHILHSLWNLHAHTGSIWTFSFLFAFFKLFLASFFCTFSCFHPLSSILQILVSIPPFHMHYLFDLVWGSCIKSGCYLDGFILSNMKILCRKTKFLMSDKLKSYFFIYDNSFK